MSIETLKQLAHLRKQIEEAETVVDEIAAHRERLFLSQIANVQHECLNTFFSYFGMDADFELDVYENAVSARYLSLEITLTVLNNGSADILRMQVSGALNVDIYHEISLLLNLENGGRKSPPPRVGNTDQDQYSNRLLELRIRALQLKDEITALEQKSFVYRVRGGTPTSPESKGVALFESFSDYLDHEFQISALAA